MIPLKNPSTVTLLAGDTLAIAVVTVAGFATHAEVNAVLRMFTTFLPLLAAWLLVAPWLGLFRIEKPTLPLMIIRTALAAMITAPLAAFIRGLWLNTPILPVFVLVLAATSALSLCLWRVLFVLFRQREAARG